MATVTEPPWLHKSSGVAARNGTTSHTINFTTDGDAPFTPANGSLLAFWIFGAVTHTVSAGGWTEQAQPVNSGELSLFTVTASSTTSITVTHNGSNYPVSWCVVEFPAGTTFVGVASNNASAEAMPNLTGLPGVAVTVFGARGRTAASASETGASAVWTGPLVEDADLFVAFSSTDGGHFTLGHQINVTATSFQPAATTTYDGSWSTPDRETVTAAFNVAASGFTKDYTISWNILNNFTKDYSIAWNVLNTFTKDYTLSWNVLNTFTKDYVIRWNVLNTFTKDYVLTWNVLNTFTKDYVVSWNILNSFTKDYIIRWDVLSGTSFTKDYIISWNVLNSFTKDYTLTWNVLNSFTKDYVIRWNVLNTFTKDYVVSWNIVVGFVKDYTLTWNVLNTFFKDYSVRWNIQAAGDPTWTFWDGSTEVEIELDGVWNGTTVVAATVEVTS